MPIENRQRALLVAAITGVALFVGDKLVRAPLWNLWQERSARITGLQKQLVTGAALLQREPGLRQAWDDMRTNTLPTDASLAEQRLLKAIDGWAGESRVSVTSISPQWKREADEYTTLQCRIEASGSLSTVSRFLYNLERDPLGLKLDSVEVSARDNDGQLIALALQLSGLVLAPLEQ